MAKNKTRPRKGRPQGMTYADELQEQHCDHCPLIRVLNLGL